MSSTTEVLSHWSTLIENFDTSPLDFYEKVELAVRKRDIPYATISRLELKEGGLFSAKRQYLKISCKKDFYFAVCGAPFGDGFFVSYWLLQPPSGCLAILFPGLAMLATATARPWTYYRADTITMFQTAVHTAIMEAFDELISGQDVPRLTEAERKPVMKEFFAT